MYIVNCTFSIVSKMPLCVKYIVPRIDAATAIIRIRINGRILRFLGAGAGLLAVSAGLGAPNVDRPQNGQNLSIEGIICPHA